MPERAKPKKAAGQNLTAEQERLFGEQGYLYLPGALAQKTVQPVKAHVLDELKRLRIWATGRALSDRMEGIPAFQQVTKLSQLIRYPRLKDRLLSQNLYSTMHRLAGTALAPEQDTQLLISLPHPDDWTLEGLNWYRDVSGSKLNRLPGVQAFVLVNDLLPRGGATLALAGSHTLKQRFQGRQSINRLLNSGAGHSSPPNDTGELILEMAGRAGDVYLMDMRLIHTPSINTTRNVRMVATIRCFTM